MSFAVGKGLIALARLAAAAILVPAVGACAMVQNAMPDPQSFRLPDRSTFLPTTINTYTGPVTSSGSVPPAELVNAQGLCAGNQPSATPRGVSLEMTECEVVRALGAPQMTEFDPTSGRRTVVLTYTAGERAGIYRFADGRLYSIEASAETPPPPQAKKPAPKKPRTTAPSAATG
jgi:hypothetical protein